MADFATTYTGRVKLRYRFLGKVRTTTIRGSTAMGLVEAQDIAQAFYDSLEGASDLLCSDWTALGWEYALPDSPMFLPLGGVPTGDIGTGSALPVDVKTHLANALHVAGRGAAGGKAGFYLFGTAILQAAGPGSDYQVFTTENFPFAQLIAGLNSFPGTFYANDGSPVSWYPRGTLKDNDYVVRKIRQGT